MAAILHHLFWLLYIIFTLDEMRSARVMTAIIFNYSCVFLRFLLGMMPTSRVKGGRAEPLGGGGLAASMRKMCLKKNE